MKVEIWSDIVCPFCYIGKRKFENALNSFNQKEQVEIIWRSFQLDADLKQIPGQTVHEYLGKRKGTTTEKGKEMNDHMTAIAREVGLEYHFDKAIINNTLNAHRLTHFAIAYGLQNEVKEALFAAYYTDGKDIGDIATLVKIGVSVGLDAEALQKMYATDAFIDAVKGDQYMAQQIGVQGVPFFVFNDKYAVSGAQPSTVFSEILEKVWTEENPPATNAAGFCTPDGICN